MNVLFLTRRFYPYIGGVETHVMEVSKALIEKGHKVTICTEEPDSSKEIKNIPNNFSEKNGINIVRIKTGKDNRNKKFRIWKELWKIKPEFEKADVIHCHDVFFWYLPFRFLYPNKKIYTTFHGYETKFPPSKKAIVLRKVSEYLSYGNLCIGEYIQKWYGTKADYVLYGGVNQIKEQRTKIKSKNIKLNIIFIGRLEKDLGVSIYIRALQKLKTTDIQYEFQSYGDGSLRKKLSRIGKVHGFVKNPELAINGADIIFCSSYLSILQALILKKTVIAVYENPLKEDYLKNSPFANSIFICKNPDEVVDVIFSIKNSPWKNKTMLENGYKWAKGQSWEKVSATYLSLWKA